MKKYNIGIDMGTSSLKLILIDEQGNVKACGREKCLELIEICSELDPFNYYGDSKLGFLNEENIFKLRWRVNA